MLFSYHHINYACYLLITCTGASSLLTHYKITNGILFLGEDQSCGGFSLAYKFVAALISPNLYPQKTKGQEDTLNKQENFDDQYLAKLFNNQTT